MAKVLFITRTLNTRGGQVVVTNLIRSLRARGHDVHYVAFKPKNSEDFPGGMPIYDGLNTEIISVEQSDVAAEQMQAYIDGIREYLLQHKSEYDRIILDSWYTVIAGILAGVDADKTYQFVQSDPVFSPRDTSALWEARLFALLPHYPMKRIVVSQSIRNLFKQRYGIAYPNVDLFIDDIYRESDFTVEERQKLRIISSAADFNIPSKGLGFLLGELDKLSWPFELTLLSGAPIKQDLTGHSYPISVTTAKTPQEMVSVLQTHDVYVNTSTSETFCLALAEAITLGMPAIALDSVGNRDYFQGDNYVFVDDPALFRDALEETSDIKVRRQLHLKARQSMSKYTLGSMTQQFCSILNIPY